MQDPSQVVPLTIIQAATFSQVITWYGPDGVTIDLTGYTADMQFRETVDDTGSPLIECSTANGCIVLGGVAGTVTVTIPSGTTSALANGQQMVYNLFVTSPGGIVYPLMAGPAYVQGSTIR